MTFSVRKHGQAVGVTSLVHDPADPAGIEIGGTLLDPRVWGSGVNAELKRLLLALCFDRGAIWVQLRTDVRNRRSAAAVLKLGAAELEQRLEDHHRRDGTRRRSRVFRVEP